MRLSRRLARAVGFVALAGIGALAGCRGSPGGSGAVPPRAGAAPAVEPARVLPATGEEIVRRVRDPGARAVLVNVWATWCVPCREEFPYLMRLHREYGPRGLRLILVSGDFASELPQVEKFLAEQGVDFTSYLRAGGDMEFINALSPDWSGALPATFIYDGGGSLRRRWEERASYEQFEREVRQVLDKRAATGG